MRSEVDWAWKLREAIERIKNQYEHIGRSTGAPFLAIIYPPDLEKAVLKEWRTLSQSMGKEFDFRTIDALEVTMSVLEELGSELVIDSIQNPMPGAKPESELGGLWIDAIKKRVMAELSCACDAKRVIVLEKLASLYPTTTPHALMQELWGSEEVSLDGPVVLLIPGTLKESRVYSFLNQIDELMYRGDIL
jgi:hypothetical protein